MNTKQEIKRGEQYSQLASQLKDVIIDAKMKKFAINATFKKFESEQEGIELIKLLIRHTDLNLDYLKEIQDEIDDRFNAMKDEEIEKTEKRLSDLQHRLSELKKPDYSPRKRDSKL